LQKNDSRLENNMFTSDAVAFVAEQKIREAMKEGAFDNLPGAGKPLVPEDLSHIPEEMRMAYKILKNSGHLEPENAKKNISLDKELSDNNPEEGIAGRRLRKLGVLMRRTRKARGQDANALTVLPDSPYMDKLVKRV
jgi:hypothetical protein